MYLGLNNNRVQYFFTHLDVHTNGQPVTPDIVTSHVAHHQLALNAFDTFAASQNLFGNMTDFNNLSTFALSKAAPSQQKMIENAVQFQNHFSFLAGEGGNNSATLTQSAINAYTGIADSATRFFGLSNDQINSLLQQQKTVDSAAGITSTNLIDSFTTWDKEGKGITKEELTKDITSAQNTVNIFTALQGNAQTSNKFSGLTHMLEDNQELVKVGQWELSHFDQLTQNSGGILTGQDILNTVNSAVATPAPSPSPSPAPNPFTVNAQQAQITLDHVATDEGSFGKVTKANIQEDISHHQELIAAMQAFIQAHPNYTQYVATAQNTITALQNLDGNMTATLANFDQLTGGTGVLTQAQIDTQLNGGQDTSKQVYGIAGADMPTVLANNPKAAAAFALLDPGNQTMSHDALQVSSQAMNDRLQILSILSQDPVNVQRFPHLTDFTQMFSNLQDGTNFLVNNTNAQGLNGQVLQQLTAATPAPSPSPAPGTTYTVTPQQAQMTLDQVAITSGGFGQVTKANIQNNINYQQEMIGALQAFVQAHPDNTQYVATAQNTISTLQTLNTNMTATLNNFDQLTGGTGVLTQSQIDSSLNGGKDTSLQVYGIPGADASTVLADNPTAFGAFTLLDPGNQNLSHDALQIASQSMNDRIQIMNILAQDPANVAKFPDLNSFSQLFAALQGGTNFMLNNSTTQNINGQTLETLITGGVVSNPAPTPPTSGVPEPDPVDPVRKHHHHHHHGYPGPIQNPEIGPPPFVGGFPQQMVQMMTMLMQFMMQFMQQFTNPIYNIK